MMRVGPSSIVQEEVAGLPEDLPHLCQEQNHLSNLDREVPGAQRDGTSG